jgi:hypothetical protein
MRCCRWIVCLPHISIGGNDQTSLAIGLYGCSAVASRQHCKSLLKRTAACGSRRMCRLIWSGICAN